MRAPLPFLACLLTLLALPGVANAGHCDAEPWPWDQPGYVPPPAPSGKPAATAPSGSQPTTSASAPDRGPAPASASPTAVGGASSAPGAPAPAAVTGDHSHAPTVDPATPTELRSEAVPLIRAALAEPWVCTPHRGAKLEPCPRGIAVKLALSRGAQVTGLLLRRTTGRLHRVGMIDLGAVKPGAWVLRFRTTADGKRVRAGQYRLKLWLRDGTDEVERSLDLRLR